MKSFVYVGTGGLTHMMTGIAFSIDASRRLNRRLILNVSQNWAFRQKFSEFFTIPGIQYSEEHRDLAVRCIEDKGYFLGDRRIDTIDEASDDEEIFFTDFCGTHQPSLRMIKCRADILPEIRRAEGEYLGVHFRNTDISNDQEEFVAKTLRKADETGLKRIYLATDDFRSADFFEERLRGLDVIRLVDLPRKEFKNLHFGMRDKRLQVMNCLTDIYNLVKSHEFMPSENSSMSRWIMEMRRLGYSMFEDPT